MHQQNNTSQWEPFLRLLVCLISPAISFIILFPSWSLIAGINLLLENGSFIKYFALFLGPFTPLVSIVSSNEQMPQNWKWSKNHLFSLCCLICLLFSSPGWCCSAQKCQYFSWREEECGFLSTSKTFQVGEESGKGKTSL